MHQYLDANHPEIGQTLMRTLDLSDETMESLRLALADFNSTWSPSNE